MFSDSVLKIKLNGGLVNIILIFISYFVLSMNLSCYEAYAVKCIKTVQCMLLHFFFLLLVIVSYKTQPHIMSYNLNKGL